MNSFLSGCIGAAILAVAYFATVALKKTWTLLDGVIKASHSIGEVLKVLRSLEGHAAQIAAALDLLNASLAGSPNSGQPMESAAAKPRHPLPPFPGPPPMYPVDYEASEDETEIVETTDKELSEIEQAESIRSNGFEVEPDRSIVEHPPGVTANA